MLTPEQLEEIAASMTPKRLFQMAPAAYISPGLQPIVARWDDEPTAIQILELLDAVRAGASAPPSQRNAFTINALSTILAAQLLREGQDYEDIVPLATWRGEDEQHPESSQA